MCVCRWNIYPCSVLWLRRYTSHTESIGCRIKPLFLSLPCGSNGSQKHLWYVGDLIHLLPTSLRPSPFLSLFFTFSSPPLFWNSLYFWVCFLGLYKYIYRYTNPSATSQHDHKPRLLLQGQCVGERKRETFRLVDWSSLSWESKGRWRRYRGGKGWFNGWHCVIHLLLNRCYFAIQKKQRELWV